MPQKKATGRQKVRQVTKGKIEHTGSPGNDQDVKRRLGNFVGAGEHARKGGRTSGIVGQKTKKLRGD